MVTIHKKRKRGTCGTGSNNYIFLINASDDYTASIFDELKTDIYRNAVEDYFRNVRELHRRNKAPYTYYYKDNILLLNDTKKIEQFILSGAYCFDIVTAKKIVEYMHRKCKLECPDVYEVLYGG